MAPAAAAPLAHATTAPRFFCPEQEAMYDAFQTGDASRPTVIDRASPPARSNDVATAMQTPFLAAAQSPSSRRHIVHQINEILLSMPHGLIQNLILCDPFASPADLAQLPPLLMPPMPPVKVTGRKPSAGNKSTAGNSDEPWTKYPCIYIVTHTNQQGKAPTRDMYERALYHMTEYSRAPSGINTSSQLQVKKIQEEIDKIVTTGSYDPRARPKYFTTNADQKAWVSWTDGFDTRSSKMPNTLNTQALAWVVSNIGYTYNASQRSIDHATQVNSNKIMNGVEAAVFVETRPYRPYAMRFKVLAHLPSGSHAGIAEHMLSLISFSYTKFGGLNGYPGGKQVASAFALPGWAYRHIELLINNSEPYRANLNREMVLAKTREEDVKQAAETKLEEATSRAKLLAEHEFLDKQIAQYEAILADQERQGREEGERQAGELLDQFIAALEKILEEANAEDGEI
ncbi:hypothetical protein BT63DRAFT_411805 [Microthyrium microscopicum]|uniref:Uncharacterized protein n=1 Tax=Microthyrium microscopicum TaxID=703497 RepID=A0A6A6UNS1_9PEZI|nr:hypothetical protein BT63DRAFT_411805 [Microthyrium microscopicum]